MAWWTRLLAGLLMLALPLAGTACGAGRAAPGAKPAVAPVLPSAAAAAAAAGSPPVPAGAFRAYVVRVVDGDTVMALRQGHSPALRVRLVGVDTPETVKPDTPVRCYGPAASAYTHALLTHRWVTAAYEPGGNRDRYGRELWDVWLDDGRMVAALLAAGGFARAYPVAPQTRYARVLRELADSARAAGRGLWGPPCEGNSFSGTPSGSAGSAGLSGAAGWSGSADWAAPASVARSPPPSTVAGPVPVATPIASYGIGPDHDTEPPTARSSRRSAARCCGDGSLTTASGVTLGCRAATRPA